VGRLAAAVGVDIKDAFSLFEHFNPGQALPQRAKRISSGQWDQPSFEMSMARKDLRLMVEEAARGGQTLARDCAGGRAPGCGGGGEGAANGVARVLQLSASFLAPALTPPRWLRCWMRG
jgi:hypothetical protein